MSQPSIAIVGGGVIGLTTAVELARSGTAVTVFRDAPAADTVSATAGALWFPFEAGPAERVRGWSLRSLERFEALADIAGTGVIRRTGTVLKRTPEIPEWSAWIPGIRTATAAELPAGTTQSYAMTVPLIEMPVYLSWLEQAAREAGARFETVTVTDPEALAGAFDAVVVAAGIASPTLVSDALGTFPIRGQIVRLENPGISNWITDDDNPAGVTYVFPRSHDVICGGTSTRSGDESWDADTEREIIERAVALVPELRGAAVSSRAVGLRPGRAEIRLERLGDSRILACYGHGGAGVTTSWGCAIEIAEMVDAMLPAA